MRSEPTWLEIVGLIGIVLVLSFVLVWGFSWLRDTTNREQIDFNAACRARNGQVITYDTGLRGCIEP